MEAAATARITGGTAADIADSIRALHDRGALMPGDSLPPVRALAERLGVNRNTVVAAYGQLSRAGIVESQGRAGTRIAGVAPIAQEGYAAQEGASPQDWLRDIASGNPDPALIPDIAPVLARAGGSPVLYGAPVIEPGFEAWARDWIRPDAPGDFSLTVTHGAADAIERLLAQALGRGDAVALEDPGFLAGIHAVRVGGYRPVPVPVDDEGMTVDGLRAALDQGVRAIVATPRAQNPTGASRTPGRAAALRAVLDAHPYVLVIEDDYFSRLSRRPFHPIVGPDHHRWALVRSLSKFIGPDIAVALVASDQETAAGLALRLRPGTAWVSHLLQRVAHGLLTDADASAQIDRAGDHYAQRNASVATLLTEAGLPATAGDGLSLWVRLPVPAAAVIPLLAARGWLVRPGDDFRVSGPAAVADRLRITVHGLTDAEAAALVADLVTVTGGASAVL